MELNTLLIIAMTLMNAFVLLENNDLHKERRRLEKEIACLKLHKALEVQNNE